MLPRLQTALVLSVTFLTLFSLALTAQEGNYDLKVNSWPANLAEFDSFRKENASTPQGAVISLIAALDIYTKDETEGRNALVLILDARNLSTDTSPKGYKGYTVSRSTMDLVSRQIANNPHLIGSYLPGSSTENGYKPSSPPYEFALTANRFSGATNDGKIKLFIPSSGASSPRPVTVQRNSKGAWKVSEFSSILVGVAKPATTTSDPVDDL